MSGNVSTSHDEYVELVLRLVERIPWGRATTYGDIAEAVRAVTGSGGPRQVGRVMALHGSAVPWWRVVRADGRLPAGHEDEARQQHLAEATPMVDAERIDLARAGWDPGATPLNRP